MSPDGQGAPVVAGEVPCGGYPGGGAGADLCPGELFTILWEALADILGTAAAATLLRRAAHRAVPRWPELAALSITRENLDYRYSVPSAWDELAMDPPQALCELARELWALLVDLTGSVVVNRLAQIPELRDRGIVPRRDGGLGAEPRSGESPQGPSAGIDFRREPPKEQP